MSRTRSPPPTPVPLSVSPTTWRSSSTARSSERSGSISRPSTACTTSAEAERSAATRPEAKSIVALGQDYNGIAATSIVTHEYGHHVANSQVNDPWPAVDWGTKRWSSYVNVCSREQGGQLFPGDEGSNYQLNPGEDFAETYRVLNERRLGVPELPWVVVDPSLYPDQGALDALALDLTSPWTANHTVAIASRFAGGATGRGFRIQTSLDGNFIASLRAPANSRFTLRVVNLANGSQLAYSGTAGAQKSVSFQVCGQRSLQIQVKRVRGAGPFTHQRFAAVGPSSPRDDAAGRRRRPPSSA